jgi:NTP pyrophosphatase (non-canonical NTP hydrolase)
MKEETLKEIIKFRNDRDWKQYHNPKDLAISLSLEAAELLENFQWSTSEEAVSKRLTQMKEELADVLIYAVLFAESTGLDLDQIVMDKLTINQKKYPADKAFGKKEKYTEL